MKQEPRGYNDLKTQTKDYCSTQALQTDGCMDLMKDGLADGPKKPHIEILGRIRKISDFWYHFV